MESLFAFESEGFYFKGKPFIPKIYDVLTLGETIPPGFNAVKIPVVLRLDADLNFKAVKAYAEEVVNQGLLILWEGDLGLFSSLLSGLSSEAQYRTLQMALASFTDELYTPFFEHSLGLALFRGTSDFTANFPWDRPTPGKDSDEQLKSWLEQEFSTVEKFCDELHVQVEAFELVDHDFMMQSKSSFHLLNLFCRDVCVDYLNLLTENMSDAIPLFILIDCSLESLPGCLAEVLAKDRFERYFLVVKGGPLPLQGMSFDDERASFGFLSRRLFELKAKDLSATAVCLPGERYYRPAITEALNETLIEMNQRLIHYRIIPEAYLIADWHGLDYIVVVSKSLSLQGKRMLKGFIAAGGVVVTVGDLLKIDQEVSFKRWKEELLEIL